MRSFFFLFSFGGWGGSDILPSVARIESCYLFTLATFLHSLAGMGTEVHSKSYLPGYYSMRDLNEDANSSSWALYYGDKTLTNGQYYHGFMPRTVTDAHPGHDRDALKQKMLEHEAIFKNQVRMVSIIYFVLWISFLILPACLWFLY